MLCLIRDVAAFVMSVAFDSYDSYVFIVHDYILCIIYIIYIYISYSYNLSQSNQCDLPPSSLRGFSLSLLPHPATRRTGIAMTCNVSHNNIALYISLFQGTLVGNHTFSFNPMNTRIYLSIYNFKSSDSNEE